MTQTICLHHVIENSSVNGPGNRFVVWLQGCPFHCDGCFNPQTHDFAGGFEIEISKLAEQINRTKNIRGLTLTGGEPLAQPESVKELLKRINKELDVLIFSGFTLNEVLSDGIKKDILYQVDAVLLGRYNKKLPHPFYGKKLAINGGRINKDELKPWLNTEINIQGDNISVTGLYKQSENKNEG